MNEIEAVLRVRPLGAEVVDLELKIRRNLAWLDGREVGANHLRRRELVGNVAEAEETCLSVDIFEMHVLKNLIFGGEVRYLHCPYTCKTASDL